MNMAVFWVVAPYDLTDVYRHSEMFDASIIMANALLHDATTQKTAVEIFAAL
jgi:hypothetical protein